MARETEFDVLEMLIEGLLDPRDDGAKAPANGQANRREAGAPRTAGWGEAA